MMIPEKKIYPRSNDTQTVYLKNVVTDPNIEVGDYIASKRAKESYRGEICYQRG